MNFNVVKTLICLWLCSLSVAMATVPLLMSPSYPLFQFFDQNDISHMKFEMSALLFIPFSFITVNDKYWNGRNSRTITFKRNGIKWTTIIDSHWTLNRVKIEFVYHKVSTFREHLFFWPQNFNFVINYLCQSLPMFMMSIGFECLKTNYALNETNYV